MISTQINKSEDQQGGNDDSFSEKIKHLPINIRQLFDLNLMMYYDPEKKNQKDIPFIQVKSSQEGSIILFPEDPQNFLDGLHEENEDNNIENNDLLRMSKFLRQEFNNKRELNGDAEDWQDDEDDENDEFYQYMNEEMQRDMEEDLLKNQNDYYLNNYSSQQDEDNQQLYQQTLSNKEEPKEKNNIIQNKQPDEKTVSIDPQKIFILPPQTQTINTDANKDIKMNPNTSSINNNNNNNNNSNSNISNNNNKNNNSNISNKVVFQPITMPKNIESSTVLIKEDEWETEEEEDIEFQEDDWEEEEQNQTDSKEKKKSNNKN